MTTENLDFSSCLQKQSKLEALFASCSTTEEKYTKIIELGSSLSVTNGEIKKKSSLVEGCQSEMYLYTSFENGVLEFSIYSDALISKGLAALLIRIYSGETPECVLKCPPLSLEKLNIYHSLSPGRSNGLASLLNKMKQEALAYYIKSNSK